MFDFSSFVLVFRPAIETEFVIKELLLDSLSKCTMFTVSFAISMSGKILNRWTFV